MRRWGAKQWARREEGSACPLTPALCTYQSQALDAALRGLGPGGRVPPSFVLLAHELEDLRTRLVAFATVGAVLSAVLEKKKVGGMVPCFVISKRVTMTVKHSLADG